MAQAPVSLKLSLPQRPGMTPRTGIVQVLQTNQSAVRPFSPIVSNNQMNTNTAIQYVRNPPEMTVLNAGNTFVATPLTQQPYGQFGTPLMAFNPNLMQTMASGVPQAVGSGQLGVAASGTGLSNLAGGRKPCNCTKSHCLKLYCECFAQGQLCQNCNCNNCMNNLNYEEERGRAIKMTLERNPTAFHPKIGRGEGERKHTKGCNCKRSGCLKNYCECYEAKISCSDLCRCQGCRNTEDSVERRSLMRLAAMGSLGSRQPSSFKKNLVKPHPETLPHVFFTWEVIEATVTCLIAQAGEAERRDLPPAAQERIILEEFGRILGHVIDSASKAQVRPPSAALHTGDSDSEHPLLHGIPSASSIPMVRREERNSASTVGAAAAAAAAADVLLGDDDDEDDEEMMREIGVDDEDDDQGDMDDDMYDDDDEDIGGSHRYRSHRPSHHSHRRITPHRSLQRHRVPGLLDEEMLSDDEPLGRSTGVSSLMSSRYRHTHSSRSKSHSMNL